MRFNPERAKIRKKSLFPTVLLPFKRSHLILKAVISYIVQLFMGVIKTRRHKLEEKKKQRRWISLSTGCCCSLFSYMALVYRMALSTDNGRMPPFVLFISRMHVPFSNSRKKWSPFHHHNERSPINPYFWSAFVRAGLEFESANLKFEIF